MLHTKYMILGKIILWSDDSDDDDDYDDAKAVVTCEI